jgi:adenosylcobalamin-dependent ribonucleoside-triphosphate reductase
MDGYIPQRQDIRGISMPGGSFGEAPIPARALDPGMGLAVARRTVFRPEDQENFGRVADRVAAGNMALLGTGTPESRREQAMLRNAIATGALLTSGRHLQHGDPTQPSRNMELFTNCATAATSFAKFYLLLNGSGVGRSYDDALMAVDWANAPDLLLYLSPDHPDHPAWSPARFAAEFGLAHPQIGDFVARELVPDLREVPQGAAFYRIDDSREGWAKAVEHLEAMAFRQARGEVLVLDFTAIRPAGSPIRGMQDRPASGPISLLRAFINIRRDVIHAARNNPGMERWHQALLLDHYLSMEVQVGGARRAARMATKSWRDPGVLQFIRAKEQGGLWTANNSVMADADFWACLRGDLTDHPLTSHAIQVFEEATRCAWVNGEPGFINGDRLEDYRTGIARQRPIDHDGSSFRSQRYQVDLGAPLLAELTRRAAHTHFPVTTNPCGEITLHVTGGYCVIADFAPLLACPAPFDSVTPGAPSPDIASLWDARVEDSVRLGVRFLMRANLMDSLYAEEVARTNRMGIGPTGLHEWAWLRFGLGFSDLLDEARAAPFWTMLERLSEIAKQEADAYARELGLQRPVTVTTVKPSGTISKLFGLTEGAHLPARAQYLRWVQFKGTRDPETGGWSADADPLLAAYESRGYPMRALRSFPGMTIVGFPTVPLIMRLGLADRLVTAPEADPAQQYHWLRLLERHWIGESQGNQVSYTLKLYTDRHDLDAFRAIVVREQSRIRCCAILPSRPDDALGYEYLPEEEISADQFAELAGRIQTAECGEAVDMHHLQCANGVCPI